MLLSETEEGLQAMLECVNTWCCQWMVRVNVTKSKIMHFRGRTKKCSNFVFRLGDEHLSYVNEYKYLGITLDEHMTLNIAADQLAAAGSHALGQVIGKIAL